MTKMIQRTMHDGFGFPPPNTKIVITKSEWGGARNIDAYVTRYHEEYPHETRLVYNESPDNLHGHYATEWLEPEGVTEGASGETIKVKPSVVDGLSDKKKRRLSEEALAKAKALGYCGEATRVIEGLGLPVKKRKSGTVTVWDDDEIVVTVNGEVVEGVFS